MMRQENLPKDNGLNKALESMSFNSQRDFIPQTPRTPSYSPFSTQTPSNPYFPFRKYLGGLYTPSSLSSVSPGSFDQTQTWSPNYNPFLEIAQHSPVWSPFGPGTIGQERGTQFAACTHQDRYGQQKRVQGQLFRRFTDNASGHHNVVDIDRIRQGTDVRTTVSHPYDPMLASIHLVTDYAT